MLYPESQVKEIQTLLSSYENKKMDSNAIIDLAFIANDMPEFNKNIKFKLNDNMYYPNHLNINNDGQLFIGMSGVREFALKRLITDLCNNGIKVYNYWVTFYVLHELENLHQYMEAYGITSYEDPRVAHIYRNIYDQLRLNDSKAREIFQLFAHERSANIYTSENMYNIVGDSELEHLARLNHLKHLVSGYHQNKHLKVIGPVYATYHMLGIEDETSFSDINLGNRFRNGLDITDSEYHLIFDNQDQPEDKDYESIVKTLK